MISTGSEIASKEILDTRSYMAANSAMQAELQILFPLRTTGVCNATNVASYDFQTVIGDDIPGLYDCEAFTTCDNYYSDTENPLAVIQYYRLVSKGKCGSCSMEIDSKSIVKSSRTIQVEARRL